VRHLIVNDAAYSEILVLNNEISLTALNEARVDAGDIGSLEDLDGNNPTLIGEQLIFHCSTIGSDLPWMRSKLAEAIDGKTVKLTTSDRKDTYWIGRVEVSPILKSQENTFVILANIDPYTYEANETVVHAVASKKPGTVLTLHNLHKQVSPTITTTGDVELIANAMRFPLSSDNDAIKDFTLSSGENTVQLVGEAALVEFKWRRAHILDSESSLEKEKIATEQKT